MATILDGKQIAAELRSDIRTELEQMNAVGKPHLAVIIVGNDGGSHSYVKGKIKACEEVGFKSTLVHYDDVSEEELLAKIAEFNADDSLHGFIVQLPLPDHIDDNKVLNAVDPKKDVDGFHPSNIGAMVLNQPCFLPATPYGISEMIRRTQIDTQGKEVVVLGRSNIVGRPISIILSSPPFNATVTVLHSRSKNIKQAVQRADIVVSAIGKPDFVTADMVKQDAIIIDVGTTRVPDQTKKSGFRIAGDVQFVEVEPKASFITPVPGGVGPMTITMLMLNTLQAFKRR